MTNFRCQGQPCTLLSSRTLFGREVCTVYLPESGRVRIEGHPFLLGDNPQLDSLLDDCV